MSIGKNIKNIRKRRNLTQSDFSKKIGISRTYLSDLENDRKSPSVETLNKISDKLNVSTSSLLSEKMDLFEFLEMQSAETSQTFSEIVRILFEEKPYYSTKEKQLVIDVFSFIEAKRRSKVDDFQKNDAINFIENALDVIVYALTSDQPSIEDNQRLVIELNKFMKEQIDSINK